MEEVRFTDFVTDECKLITEHVDRNMIEMKFNSPKLKENNILSFAIYFESKIMDKSKSKCMHCITISGFEVRSEKIKDVKSFFLPSLIYILTELSWAAYHHHITAHLIYTSPYRTFNLPNYKSMQEINSWVKNALSALN